MVATPGRAVDHLKRGSLNLDAVRFVVLDEADEMLDMGFAEDLDTILSATPGDRQTALFSATISPTITRIAKRHLRDPARFSVHAEKRTGRRRRPRPPDRLRRSPRDKLAALCRILDVEDPTSALVFARTRGEVDDLAEALSSRGHDAGALHGGLAQEARDRIMGRFRDGSLDVLVATDVAARGLDIDHVSHVVNYDVPSDPTPTCIASAERAGPDARAWPSPCSSRASIDSCATSSGHQSKLELARLPTVADLRERRLELLRANLRDALETGGHDRFRGVVEPLTEEFDVVDIALAAVSLIEGAETRDEDEVELAQASLQQPGRRTEPEPRPGGPGAGARPRARSPVVPEVQRPRDRRAARSRPTAGSSSGSAAAGVPASARATSSGRSPTRRASRDRWSVPSSCSTTSRSSTSRARSPTRSSTRCARPRSAAAISRSAASDRQPAAEPSAGRLSAPAAGPPARSHRSGSWHPR